MRAVVCNVLANLDARRHPRASTRRLRRAKRAAIISWLGDVEGYSEREIAERLGLSTRTVERARADLRAL